MAKIKVTLNICGVQLSLSTEETQAYMEALAEKVRTEMSAYLEAGLASRETAAVAALLSLYERMDKQDSPVRGECDALKAEVKRLKEACARLEAEAKTADRGKRQELEKLRKELEDQEGAALSERDALRAELNKVEQELVQREAELKRERDAWQQEIGRLKQKAKERETAVEEENGCLKKSLAEAEAGARAEAEMLQGEIARLQKSIEEGAALTEAAKTAEERAAESGKQAEIWRQQAVELQGQLEDLELKAKRESDALCMELMELRQRLEAAPGTVPERGQEERPAGEKRPLKNPMRQDYEQQGFVSFFEK